MVNNWHIGREQEGRGLLLLLVEDSKQIKLEVGYELEDVFTDAFSGYVEDLQLGPYYRSGDVGTGMIAVMEMLEQRAQTKHLGEYTSVQIAGADAELLAGGAGAMRDLERYEQRRQARGLRNHLVRVRGHRKRPGRSCLPSGPVMERRSPWIYTPA